MTLRKGLEFAIAEYKDNGQKLTMGFIDREDGVIREVNFNKQEFDQETQKFKPSEEKAKICEEWAQEHFGVPFDRIGELANTGLTKDIYCYDNFSSLWESKQFAKFDKDMVGQIFEATVTGVEDDGTGIKILFDYEGETYRSNMGYGNYVEALKQWFKDEVKQVRQYKKFEEKFHISIENKEELIGKTVMIEVKQAFGNAVYAEIKPFAKKKK